MFSRRGLIWALVLSAGFGCSDDVVGPDGPQFFSLTADGTPWSVSYQNLSLSNLISHPNELDVYAEHPGSDSNQVYALQLRAGPFSGKGRYILIPNNFDQVAILTVDDTANAAPPTGFFLPVLDHSSSLTINEFRDSDSTVVGTFDVFVRDTIDKHTTLHLSGSFRLRPSGLPPGH